MTNSVLDRISRMLGDGYVVERELGAGMSRVVVARDVALGRRVVVKMLPADWAAGLSAERFRREVVLAAGLQHPHIVPLLTAGEAADGTLFYTMPYVDGQSLRSRLKDGIPPLKDTLRWLRDVASALSYAHARGVVHRDMKPDNILLSNNYAVVADFGIAKALSSASATLSNVRAAVDPITSMGMALGTPAYMAPEQVAADADADHRTDLYALGIIAYELLTGEPPFKGSAQSILVSHLTVAPEPLAARREGLPSALTSLVMHCLAKEAGDRPATADVVVAELESVLRGISNEQDAAPRRATPTTARTAATATSPAPRPRRALALASVGVIIIAVAAFVLWPRVNAPTIVANRIAVATPRDQSSNGSMRELVRTLAADVTADLVGLDSADVASREDVERVESTSPRGDVPIQSLATQLKSGLVITGVATPVGADSVRLSFAVMSGVDGRPIHTLADVVVARDKIRERTARLRQRLAGAVATIASRDFHRAMLPTNDPPVLPALLAIRDGLLLEAGLRQPDPDEDESVAELARFDRAVDAEPEFDQARLWFASAALRRPGGEVLADSALALVQAQLDRLTPYEKALLEALSADAKGNHELSVRGWRRARDLAPVWPNRWWLAMKLRDANRPREALAIVDSLGKDNAQFRRTEPGLRHFVGDFTGEYRALRDERRRAPSTAQSLGYQQALLQSLAALDSVRVIDSLLNIASQLPAEPGSSLAFLLTRTSWELAAHRHAKESTAALQRAVSWCKRRTSTDLANGAVAFDCMEAYGYAGYIAPLTAIAEPALRARANDIDLSVLGVLGVAAALRGERVVAQQFSTRIEQATRADGSHGLASWLRGRIAAAIGDAPQAVEFLEDAFARGAGWSQRLDLHRDPAFAKLNGNEGFERLKQPQD